MQYNQRICYDCFLLFCTLSLDTRNGQLIVLPDA